MLGSIQAPLGPPIGSAIWASTRPPRSVKRPYRPHQLVRHSSIPLQQAAAPEGASCALLTFHAFWLSTIILQWLLDTEQGAFISCVYRNRASCESTAKQLFASRTGLLYIQCLSCNEMWLISKAFECYLQMCLCKIKQGGTDVNNCCSFYENLQMCTV